MIIDSTVLSFLKAQAHFLKAYDVIVEVQRSWFMILLSIGFTYLMIRLTISLMKTQDERYKTKREQDRQRRELREALRQNARMR